MAGNRDGAGGGKKRAAWAEYLSLSTLGIEMGAALAVGMGIGWVLDRWLKTEPWLLVIFTAFGIAAGFRNILKVAREQSRANAADERKGRDDEQ